jgi:hypothetical protein
LCHILVTSAGTNRVSDVVDATEKQMLRAVRTAQARFEREQAAAHEARRKTFADAQKAGLTLRAIGKEVGLHHTRVGQIIRGE